MSIGLDNYYPFLRFPLQLYLCLGVKVLWPETMSWFTLAALISIVSKPYFQLSNQPCIKSPALKVIAHRHR